MSISQLLLRPFEAHDAELLNLFRKQFSNDGRTDAPFGYSRNGVETIVVERDEKVVGAVMATASVVVDFMRDPAARGEDVYGAVLMGERTLTYMSQKSGLVAAYCAIPSHLTKYIDMVKRSGYSEVFQNCVVLRRPLAKESLLE
jgi:hypothetical protein